jgi:hypothetical protein
VQVDALEHGQQVAAHDIGFTDAGELDHACWVDMRRDGPRSLVGLEGTGSVLLGESPYTNGWRMGRSGDNLTAQTDPTPSGAWRAEGRALLHGREDQPIHDAKSSDM